MEIKIHEGFPDIEVIIKCPEATDEIKKMVSLLQETNQKLTGMKDGQIHLIDKQDVLYFESVDKRCFIYTAADVYETSLKLYEIEELLSDAPFIRSSKSQILNIMKITSLCPEFGSRLEAVLQNGEKLIVSRQYSKSLKERLGLG